MKYNPKFSIDEMTANRNGKTSGSATMGIIIILVGTICFLLGCIDKMWISNTIDVITQSIIFTGIGVTLLGYNKSQQKNEDITSDKNEPLV